MFPYTSRLKLVNTFGGWKKIEEINYIAYHDYVSCNNR